jgi:demethylmenaquinone methyltransferase/2-methoxy-6-polyprenyl-1,4-benzoquinol methylase
MPSLDKSAPQVQEMFGAIAGRYDLLNHLLSANQDVRWRRRGVRWLHPRRGEAILDLCCGTGDLAFEILHQQPHCHVTGADFAVPMLEIARRKADGRQQTAVTFVQQDALNLSFDNATFDAVTVGFGVRNFQDTETGLREIYRVLKPGGRVMILEFMRPTSWFLRYGFGLFFKGILPRVGKLISKHNSAYSYLPASVGDFYTRREFENLLRECGFAGVRSCDLSLGAATCFVARKQQL